MTGDKLAEGGSEPLFHHHHRCVVYLEEEEEAISPPCQSGPSPSSVGRIAGAAVGGGTQRTDGRTEER